MQVLAYTLAVCVCVLKYMISSKTQPVCILGIFIDNSQDTFQIKDLWPVSASYRRRCLLFMNEEEAASSPPLILCLPLQLSLCICPT